jgi:hypothetical protein
MPETGNPHRRIDLAQPATALIVALLLPRLRPGAAAAPTMADYIAVGGAIGISTIIRAGAISSRIPANDHGIAASGQKRGFSVISITFPIAAEG